MTISVMTAAIMMIVMMVTIVATMTMMMRVASKMIRLNRVFLLLSSE